MLTKNVPSGFARRSTALLISFILLISTAPPMFSQARVSGAGIATSASKKRISTSARKNNKNDGDSDEIMPERLTVEPAGIKTTAQIMDEQAARGEYKSTREWFRELGIKRKKKTHPDRAALAETVAAFPDANRYPVPDDRAAPGAEAP